MVSQSSSCSRRSKSSSKAERDLESNTELCLGFSGRSGNGELPNLLMKSSSSVGTP
jgi:hypothetical protein